MRHLALRLSVLFLLLGVPSLRAGDSPPLRIGSPPPAADWLSTEGDTLAWEDLRGDRPLVMMFWATWCASCKKAWPALSDLAGELGEEGPVWAAASLGESVEKVAREAAKRGWPGPVLADPQETNAKRLGIQFVPTVCVLDASGTITYLGEPHPGKIRRALASKEGD